MATQIRHLPVHPVPTGPRRRPGSGEGLALRPSARLREFLVAAAEAGLPLGKAVSLGVERALVLADAAALLADSDAARRELSAIASRARPRLELTAAQASRVRTLSAARAVAVTAIETPLVVALPDRLLARARGKVPASALHAAAVPEMVSWEIAATLEGRTMSEWALLLLARRG